MEIKTSATYHTDFLKGIKYWKKIQPQNNKSYVVYTGTQSIMQQETRLLNWKKIGDIPV